MAAAAIFTLPFAAENKSPASLSLEVELPLYDTPELSPRDAAIVSAIEKGVEDIAEVIDLLPYNIPYDQSGINTLLNCYNSVRYAHTEYFWLTSSFAYSASGGYISSIKPKYLEAKEDIEADKLLLEEEVNKALSVLLPDMSDIEKALAVHDYLALNAEYDYERYLQDTLPQESYTIKGVMIDKIGVCQSYAYAYKYILLRAGVDCVLVSSDEMQHMWNLVQIDGEWYHVDVTWDDPVWDRFGRVLHTSFLCSDTDISSKEGGKSPHIGWVSDITCTSTAYDKAFFKNTTSAVVFDDDYMYVSYDSSGVIAAVDRENNDEQKTLYTVKDKWRVKSGYYPGSFAKLSIFRERLYFNLPGKIVSMMTDGSDVQTEYTSSVNIWGIVLRGNELYYTCTEDYYASDMTPLKATGYITLSPKQISSIKIEKPSYTFGVGQRIPISATVNAGATADDVTWQIKSGAEYAELSGMYIIPKKKGTVVLRAASKYDENIFDDVTFNIEVVFGDGNGDGQLNISDAVLFAQYLAEWEVGFAEGTQMDLNLDGKVNISDAVLFAQYLAEWEVSLCTPAN